MGLFLKETVPAKVVCWTRVHTKGFISTQGPRGRMKILSSCSKAHNVAFPADIVWHIVIGNAFIFE
jgi:hypothetical protein